MRKTLPLPLVLVAALFIGPVILAVALYFGPMKLDGLDMLPNPDREFFAEPETLVNVPLTTPPGLHDRNLAYAVQWFALALGAATLGAGLFLRPSLRPREG